ncbi:MAG: sodium-translocating pyrophosphatase [Synergistaceae bacterium]|jgi:K(+)-stimulated pyrophosphate-energized sodium pump|nr:sodium-translocating pyrophosphatase [Synergistaceae bacterium]
MLALIGRREKVEGLSSLYVSIVVVAVAALVYAKYAASKISAYELGNERVKELSSIIQSGAMAFLYREYKALSGFVVVVAAVLAFYRGMPTAACFVGGALCSALTGYAGMKVATKANGKTSFAATKGMNEALGIAFKGGSVVGMTVVGVGLMGVFIAYMAFGNVASGDVETIAAFGFGASSIALFARVGGGIYTKAADVGADLVGKIEAGIPEDDPRNPAVIADNVGDNVGDIAGMGADLFESYVNAILAAMAVGFVAYKGQSLELQELQMKSVVYPMLLSAVGIISALLGTFFVKVKEGGDPQKALSRGLYTTGILMAAGTFFLTKWMFGGVEMFWAVVAGVACGVIIGQITEIYTSADYASVKEIAGASVTGTATNILAGISVGMKSTVAPVLFICAATLIGYWAGGTYGAERSISYWGGGMYGVACAAVGMLSITGMVLSVDAYGPISDNAGGIAEMAGLPEEVRGITDRLDAVGNTTAAVGKGLAIGSAALTALALFVSYASTTGLDKIDIMDAKVIVGLFIGGVLPFIFSALSIQAVSRAAERMIEEVRRQFREIPGIMDGTARPQYEKCVDISTAAAMKEMVLPGMMAVIVPLVVGKILGAAALGGLLGGSIVTGVMMAIFMSNAGGAWDNAKKYIESGQHGGKGSAPHAAAVNGDTVGDPFKDTAGPSLNILIKLMTVVSLVMAPWFPLK